jgi:hypothetical protein
MHSDLQQACYRALAIPRADARQRAMDFSWKHATELFQSFLVPARGGAPANSAVVTKLSSPASTLSR